jgi:tetratricopeptide (TPR) repeat protein
MSSITNQDIITLLCVFLSLGIVRVISTAIHEAGHAIPYILMTRKPVIVFLGTYGDTRQCISFPIGRSKVWLLTNPFRWRGGMCQPTEAPDKKVDYWFTLGGPLATFVQGIVLLAIIFFLEPAGFWLVFCVTFAAWSAFSFLWNVSPLHNLFPNSTGTLMQSDGVRLRQLAEARNNPPEYDEATALVASGKLSEAAQLLDRIIHNGTKNADIYRTAIHVHLKLKQYGRADELQKEQIQRIGNISDMDRVTLGLLKIMLGRYEDAIAYYQHLMQFRGINKYNLNNYGFVLTLVGRYEEAIPVLDRAIAIDSTRYAPFSNRAFAKMMTGQEANGYDDNEVAKTLNPEMAYIHRNTGAYYFARRDYQQSLEYFEKARELDPQMPRIDDYLREVRAHI